MNITQIFIYQKLTQLHTFVYNLIHPAATYILYCLPATAYLTTATAINIFKIQDLSRNYLPSVSNKMTPL